MFQNEEFINHRQISWMACTIIIAGGLITFPRELVRVGGKDAWTFFTLPLTYAFLVALLFRLIMHKYPGLNIYGVMTEGFGKIVGNLFNVVLIVYFWFLLVRDISALSYFMNSTILLHTPREMIVLLFGLTLLYYGRLGLEAVAHVNDFSLPFLIVILVSMPFMLTDKIEPHLMLPAFAGTGTSYYYGNLINLGWYGDIIICGAFLHAIKQAKKTHTYLRHGIAVATMFLMINVWLNIVVLGPNITGRMLFPNYILVEQIQITDFLDRLEVVVYGFWFPLYLTKTAITMIALLIGVAHFNKQRHYRTYSSPVNWILVLTSVTVFNSVSELSNFNSYGITFVMLAVITPIFLLTALRTLLHKRTETASVSERTGNEQEPMQPPPKKRPVWFHLTNLLILIYALLVVVGMNIGLDYPKSSTAATIAIAFTLAAVVLTTYLETRFARKNGEEASNQQPKKT